MGLSLVDGLALERELFARTFATRDAEIGVRSFLERGPGKAEFIGAVTGSPVAKALRATCGLMDTGSVAQRNVLGGELEPCGVEPMTGFYRDGCCTFGPEDLGSHTICAVVTAEFLEHQRRIGNDLVTPVPEYRFPGAGPGRSLVRDGGELDARLPGRSGMFRRTGVDQRGGARDRAPDGARGARRRRASEPPWPRRPAD